MSSRPAVSHLMQSMFPIRTAVRHLSTGSSSAALQLVAMHFHHIYNARKKDAITSLADEHGLTGVYLFGKPGRVIIEGEEARVQQWVREIKQLRWQQAVMRVRVAITRRHFGDFGEADSERDLARRMESAGLADIYQCFHDLDAITAVESRTC